MIFWETALAIPELPDVERDFAEVWRAADKIVYSRTLESTSSERTRIERELDPEAIRALKASTERDITVGGPELAGQAFAAGLVDEVQMLISPVLVGGGKPALPEAVRLDLELLDERRFGNGSVFLRYRIHRPQG